MYPTKSGRAFGAMTGLVILTACTTTADVVPPPAPMDDGPSQGYTAGSLSHLTTWEAPRPFPDLAFSDGEGRAVHLHDFKGQVVVLNVWATWVAPARFEMPTLAQLQTTYADRGLVVVALSADMADQLNHVKMSVAKPLVVYIDPDFMASSQDMGIYVLPTTIIIDRQGREVARFEGDTRWDTPEAYALMDRLLAE